MLSLSRWSPFEEMANFHREFDRTFARSGGRQAYDWTPAVEVTSGKEAWMITAALPGASPDDVHVDIDNQVLTIKGERRAWDESAEAVETYVSELHYGSFERRFTIPDNVDGEKVSASFENGMLTLTLPVTEAAKPRKIEIMGASTKKVA